jgi:hypothetical protein
VRLDHLLSKEPFGRSQDLSIRSVLQLSIGAGQAPECGTLTIKLPRQTRRQYFLLAGVETRRVGRRGLSTLLGPEGSVADTQSGLPADRRPVPSAPAGYRPHLENFTVDASIFVVTTSY